MREGEQKQETTTGSEQWWRKVGPDRLSRVGRSLVDEDEVVVVEVNGLAYPSDILKEVERRYNKYPGLKRECDALREAVTTGRSHMIISGTDILRMAAEQVDSVALARDLRSMALDLDAILDESPESDE